MHLGDSIFIFILALVLFGPKKLPEMARQIGKLMAEFRRASNDFRLQIDEELRTMERQEQLEKQKKQENERAALAAPGIGLEPSILPPALEAEPLGRLPGGESPEGGSSLQFLPPRIGEQVSAGTPYAISATESEDHPLLRVDSVPLDPGDPRAGGSGPTGIAVAEANAARLGLPIAPHPETATEMGTERAPDRSRQASLEPTPAVPDNLAHEQAPVANG